MNWKETMLKTNPIDATRSVLKEYASRVGAFRPNARLYLLNVIITGAAMGIFRLLFNFYVLSLGYDEALLGRLVTTSSVTALLAALPSGYLADQLGRKNSLLLSGFFTSLSILCMVIWPGAEMFYVANIAFGIAQSLAGVTMGPSRWKQRRRRTHLPFQLQLWLADGIRFCRQLDRRLPAHLDRRLE
jgi:Na+/melibiose symporter-like transporter